MADEIQPTETVTSTTGNAPGTVTPVTPEKSGEKLFTQDDLNRAIDDRLKRERSKAETQAQKAQQEVDERRKVEQGEWQKLAEDRKAQIDQLTPKGELAERLQALVAKQLETELAAWPESVRAIMPAADSPLLERIEWAERTRPLAQELMAAKGQQPAPGTRYPAQHAGSGGAKPENAVDVFLQRQNEARAKEKNPLLKER